MSKHMVMMTNYNIPGQPGVCFIHRLSVHTPLALDCKSSLTISFIEESLYAETWCLSLSRLKTNKEIFSILLQEFIGPKEQMTICRGQLCWK